jgi:hypothetical protein
MVRHLHIFSSPPSASQSPPPTTTLKVEIIFDQTLLRSAFSTVFDAGLLAHTLTPLHFSKLNTSNFCFLSASLCQQYPNEGIIVSAAAAAAPSVDVNTSGVAVFLDLALSFSANSSAGHTSRSS